MGQCRPDYAANVQERDISVTTPYGRIRGFYTHLFDGPGVVLGDRPGVYHSGKLWRTVSTFLGIPYAQPPVNEGRFKVSYIVILAFLLLHANIITMKEMRTVIVRLIAQHG